MAAAAAPAAAAATPAVAAGDAKNVTPLTLAQNFASGNAALLVMDYQNGIFARAVPDKGVADALVTRANTVIRAARAARVPVIHVRVANAAGATSAAKHNRVFGAMAGTGWMVDGNDDTKFLSGVDVDAAADAVVTKRRFGAFHGTDLSVYLSAANVRHLVLFGVSTSGCVLTTVRYAFDMDFVSTVVGDCCHDADAQVHEVLLGKVLPRQAVVATSADVIKQLETLAATATATAAATAAK